MNASEERPYFLPGMPMRSDRHADRVREDGTLDWFHRIDFGDFVTPGAPYGEHWSWVARFLEAQAAHVRDASILELGPADGLWSCWLTKLGCREIVAADVADRDQYRMVVETFDLPVTYHAGLISSATPEHVQRRFDAVVSLGVLYHVHDPFTTLVMYHRYLQDGGVLVLEGGTVVDDRPVLYYTGQGLLYGAEGGNYFLASRGFLYDALQETLGMDILAYDYHAESHNQAIDKEVGRSILIARKARAPYIHHYDQLLSQLGMHSAAFEA